jgi:hypothetical protein
VENLGALLHHLEPDFLDGINPVINLVPGFDNPGTKCTSALFVSLFTGEEEGG